MVRHSHSPTSGSPANILGFKVVVLIRSKIWKHEMDDSYSFLIRPCSEHYSILGLLTYTPNRHLYKTSVFTSHGRLFQHKNPLSHQISCYLIPVNLPLFYYSFFSTTFIGSTKMGGTGTSVGSFNGEVTTQELSSTPLSPH
jgi:hypothetical protein